MSGNPNRLSGINDNSAWIGATFEPVVHDIICRGGRNTLRASRYRIRITLNNFDQVSTETQFQGTAEIFLSLI